MSRIKIKATVISPLSIGDGGEYSPYKDYWIDKGQVCFVDQLKLGQLLATNENLMNEYVEGVSNMDGNRSRFSIKDFVVNRLKQQPEKLLSRCVEFKGNAGSNLPIKTITHNPMGQGYIPGSSIKGALKTVLLYDWLTDSDDGKMWVKDFFRFAEMDIDVRDHINKIDEELKILAGVEEKNKKYSPLIVTDSSAISQNNFGIFDMQRGGAKGIPIRQECLKPKTEFVFEIDTDKFTWKQLAEMTNIYSSNNLDGELDEGDDEKKAGHIQKCENFLIRVENEIGDALENDNGTAYIMLGFGKGVYYNSILVALKDYAKENNKKAILEKYLYKLFYERLRKEKLYLDLFPVTRFLTQDPSRPLGWVKMECID